jgi:AbiV family abortive infection protein
VQRRIGGDRESWERIWREQREKAEAAAKKGNLLKHRGFYVDQGKDGSIQTPADIEQGTLAQDLKRQLKSSKCSAARRSAAGEWNPL